MILPDGFEARVSSYEDKERFINSFGVKFFFSYFITLPFLVYVIFILFFRGIRTNLNKMLNKPDNYSTQAALVCVGQVYTIYTAIMDAIALSKGGLAPYMFGIIITVGIIEFISFLFIATYAFIFMITQSYRPFIVVFKYACLPLFLNINKKSLWSIFSEAFPWHIERKTIRCKISKAFPWRIAWQILKSNIPNIPKAFSWPSDTEIVSWFVVVALIPPLLCLSSHIGFIIEGWISRENHATAVMLFYGFTFTFMFVSFRKLYMALSGKDSQELNFRILFFEMTIGAIVFFSAVAYIVKGLVSFPVLNDSDNVIRYFYDLGSIAFIFVFFVITYITLFKTSTSAISEDVLMFWKYLYNKDSEVHIDSDVDKANALSAVVLFRLLQWKPNGTEDKRFEELLSEVVGKKEGGGDSEGANVPLLTLN